MTALPTRPLGATGMRISVVGLGASALGGARGAHRWGHQDDADSLATIRHAIDRGVNWIDTAAVYGLGHSETIVGTALKDLPADRQPYVFTKGGMVWDPDDHTRPAAVILSPASLRREVHASLRRLGRPHIDLYQIHWPPADGAPGTPGTPPADYWETLVDLRAEGLVRAIGLSNHRLDRLAEAAAIGAVDVVQPPLSAIRRDYAEEIAWSAAHGVGVITYSPLQAGLLSGSYTEARVRALEPGDWRVRDAEFRGTRLRRNLALAAALRPIADRHGVGTADVAVAAVLAWPGVSGAIVGARRPSQVDGWLAGARLTLTDDDIHDLNEALRRTGAGTGPRWPRRQGLPSAASSPGR